MGLTRYLPQFVRRDRRCYYCSPSGNELVSISAILSATKSPQEWAQLKAWRRRVGNEAANRITQASTQRGQLLHQRIEQYLLGQPLQPCPLALQPWRDSLRPVLRAIQDVQLVEGAVFHEPLRYAGTVDAISRYQQRGYGVFDWKTANTPRQSAWVLNYQLQVAALWGAILQTYGVQLEYGLIAIALPDQEAQLFWLEALELEQLWHQWVLRVEQFWQQVEVKS